MSARRLPLVALVPAGLLAGLLAGCGGSSTASGGSSGTGAEAATTLRLGYFPNVTHASALVGVERGIFARALEGTRLRTSTFNAGPAAVEALFSDALDATYIGPNPAINAFVRSKGEAVRVVSGATSGGAALVVHPSIGSAADLRGRKIATPQLGGTQDVALRFWLKGKGLATDPAGGGDVRIAPQENAQTLETFRSGHIDGAWVPEPWATRLVLEAGGKVLVDERDLWPDRRFVTTLVLVRTEFLEDHPDAVRRLLEGQVEANRFVNDRPVEARAAVNAKIERITGKKLPDATIEAAWENLTFTNDPVASSLTASAAHAEAVGLLPEVELRGIFALDPLNEVLRARDEGDVRS